MNDTECKGTIEKKVNGGEDDGRKNKERVNEKGKEEEEEEERKGK